MYVENADYLEHSRDFLFRGAKFERPADVAARARRVQATSTAMAINSTNFGSSASDSTGCIRMAMNFSARTGPS